MPEQFKRWGDRARDLHQGWTFRLWSESSLGELGLDFADLVARYPSLAGVSNAVRLVAIHRFGGVYLDADVECLKPLDALLAYPAFTVAQDMIGEPSRNRYCNAVFGAEAGHPWVRWQVEHMVECVGRDANWGPELMTTAPQHSGLTVLPRHWVYPFLWDAPGDRRTVCPDSLAVHHWAKSWV